MQSPPPAYMTTEQIARLFGVSTRTVRRWIQTRKYPLLSDNAVVQRYRKGNIIQYRYFVPVEVVYAVYEQRKREAVAMRKEPRFYLNPFPDRKGQEEFRKGFGNRVRRRISFQRLIGSPKEVL